MSADAIAPLRYVAIPPEIAQEARCTRVDRFGHRLSVVSEFGPCRVCLRIEPAPSEFILLSYQPLPDRGPYAEIGPIFIHAEPCKPYAQTTQFPADFASRRLILRAYGHDGAILDAKIAPPGEAPAVATALLTDESVAEIHVRHVSYTCFDFKIFRGQAARDHGPEQRGPS